MVDLNSSLVARTDYGINSVLAMSTRSKQTQVRKCARTPLRCNRKSILGLLCRSNFPLLVIYEKRKMSECFFIIGNYAMPKDIFRLGRGLPDFLRVHWFSVTLVIVRRSHSCSCRGDLLALLVLQGGLLRDVVGDLLDGLSVGFVSVLGSSMGGVGAVGLGGRSSAGGGLLAVLLLGLLSLDLLDLLLGLFDVLEHSQITVHVQPQG